MDDIRGCKIRVTDEKINEIVSLWLGDTPMHVSEVIAETGASKYVVTQVLQKLKATGHHVKRKKQNITHLSRMVISGNSERDSDKKRAEEKAKRSETAKQATKIRERLNALMDKREDESINNMLPG